MSADEWFAYDGVAADVDFGLLELARQEMYEHLEEAEEKEESRDGIPFCGCSDCDFRVMSGFWISWVLKTQAEGLITLRKAE